jgi:hypothetical protein
MFCKQEVRIQGMNFPRYHQCKRQAVKDGYCLIHHPENVAKREKDRGEKLLKKVELQIKTKYALKNLQKSK